MTEAGAARRKLDRYELIAEIASGGMGTVVLARVAGAGGFQRLFAVKMMHPHLVEDAQFVSMLLDEARLAARIHHPNVVATVDVCASAVGYYIVMDYVDGFTLTHVLEAPSLAARDRLRIVIRILLDTLAGLEAAHNLVGDDGGPLGMVHRDVSPHNILVGLDGIARLTDFGIALAASRITSSRPGIIKGKPAYMAPEQARAEAVDQTADLWALGVILWESLMDRQLFAADSDAATVLRVITAEVPRPRSIDPKIPTEIEAVCLRALQRPPGQRYRSARQMAQDLERAAKKHDLLADSHEVAEAMKATFDLQIQERRAAIRRHVSAMAPETAPMGMSDLYQLPKLQQTPIPGASAMPQTAERRLSDQPATTPARRAAGAAGNTPHPETRVAPTPAQGTSTHVPPPRSRSVVYAALGVLAIAGIAAYALFGGTPEAGETRGTLPVTAEPGAGVAASAAPQTSAPQSAVPATALAGTALPETSAPATEEPATARRRRRQGSEETEGGGDVPVEENPYRAR